MCYYIICKHYFFPLIIKKHWLTLSTMNLKVIRVFNISHLTKMTGVVMVLTHVSCWKRAYSVVWILMSWQGINNLDVDQVILESSGFIRTIKQIHLLPELMTSSSNNTPGQSACKSRYKCNGRQRPE